MNNQTCPSRFTIVSYVADDLNEKDSHDLGIHLKSCELCSATLLEIRSNANKYKENMNSHMDSIMTAMDAEPIPFSKKPVRSRLLYIAPAATLAAAAAVALLIISPSIIDKNMDEHRNNSPVAFKGTLGVQVVARRDREQFIVND